MGRKRGRGPKKYSEKWCEIRELANKKGLDPVLAEYCSNEEDIEVLLECQKHIDHFVNEYNYAISVAPKHPERVRKRIDKLLVNANSEAEMDGILSEYRSLEPWLSNVKSIKYEALGYCEEILRENGFGKKVLKKDDLPIMQVLHERLRNPKGNEDSFTDEEIKWIENLEF